jgi:hypothetical protein
MKNENNYKFINMLKGYLKVEVEEDPAMLVLVELVL